MSERDPELVRLERQTHEEAITPWVAKHANQPGSDIVDIGYDPEKYPFQRLDVPLTPAKTRNLPNLVILTAIKFKLGQSLHSHTRARSMVKTLQDTEAYEGSSTSIAEETAAIIESGGSVDVLTDHTEKGNYRDIAQVIGALILSTGRSDYRYKSAIYLGLNMSRQGRKTHRFGRVKPLADQVSEISAIIWTMQNTDSRKEYPFPTEAVRLVARGAKVAKETMEEDGAIFGIVPAGTALELTYDSFGNPKLVRPKVELATIHKLRESRALLPVGMTKEGMLPGPMYVADVTDGLSRKERIAAGNTRVHLALRTLAQNNADLKQIPFSFTDGDGQETTIYPRHQS